MVYFTCRNGYSVSTIIFLLYTRMKTEFNAEVFTMFTIYFFCHSITSISIIIYSIRPCANGFLLSPIPKTKQKSRNRDIDYLTLLPAFLLHLSILLIFLLLFSYFKSPLEVMQMLLTKQQQSQ